jgi:hypothetical protein
MDTSRDAADRRRGGAPQDSAILKDVDICLVRFRMGCLL